MHVIKDDFLNDMMLCFRLCLVHELHPFHLTRVFSASVISQQHGTAPSASTGSQALSA